MTIQIIDTIRDVTLNDKMLCYNVGKVLNKHYPDHIWAVNVNSQGGVVDILAYNISKEYGMRLLYTEVANDPSLTCVIKAGGELLERAWKARGRNDGQKPATLEGAKLGDRIAIENGIIR